MNIFDVINSLENYFGEVVDVDKTSRVARIRVRVKTVFDEIPVEYIPWAYPRFMDSSEVDLPAIGDVVAVNFMQNDIMFPYWYRWKPQESVTAISDDDYPSCSIIREKNLAKYGIDGHLSVRYTNSEGVVVELKRNDATSSMTVRPDNSVILSNGKTGQKLHISDSNISIGSENTSQQPGVVGDDNHQALDMLNDTILELSKKMDTMLQLTSQVAGTSPYTKHLQAPLKKYAKEVKTLIDKLHDDNKTFFPETKSQVVTIDKTNENG